MKVLKPVCLIICCPRQVFTHLILPATDSTQQRNIGSAHKWFYAAMVLRTASSALSHVVKSGARLSTTSLALHICTTETPRT